ncbi:MAG: hypothetical protein IKT81_00090 [Clostridia bacterium]|nr:hypothetical protein [Clostridia bacterium]
MGISRTKNAMLNTAFSLVLQLTVFAKGLVLLRLIVPAYGSDVNGLIASILQFLAYISLIEAGAGAVFRGALYAPLSRGDMSGVSAMINAQKRFYRRIGLIFGGYVAVLCVVYPLVAQTGADRGYVVSLILILSISTFAEYFVSLPYISLITADQKIRISHIVSIVYTLANMAAAVVCVRFGWDVRALYGIMCLLGMLKPIFYALYVKKHYPLSRNTPPDRSCLAQRKDGMVHHLAYCVHTGTDAAILTVAAGTALVSVYNVYGAIVFGIEKLVTSISGGAAAGLGNLIASGQRDKLDLTVDRFELVQAAAATWLYTVTGLMLMPFVRLYTAAMTDISYIRPAFGYVLIAAEVIFCFRSIYSTVSSSANRFKETRRGALLECAVNLTLSLILVLTLKKALLAVAIGTAAGMAARYLWEIVYLSRHLLRRPIAKPLKMLAVSALGALGGIAVCRGLLDYAQIGSVWEWVSFGVATALITAAVAAALYWVFYRQTVRSLLRMLSGRG